VIKLKTIQVLGLLALLTSCQTKETGSPKNAGIAYRDSFQAALCAPLIAAIEYENPTEPGDAYDDSVDIAENADGYQKK
jgi:hypothetical protein